MAEAYTREIARVACGQLAELAGYEVVQDSALEVLAELLIKYISELSASSHGYAEVANRSGINVHDILLALDDLGTTVPELQTYLSSLTPVRASWAPCWNVSQAAAGASMVQSTMHTTQFQAPAALCDAAERLGRREMNPSSSYIYDSGVQL